MIGALAELAGAAGVVFSLAYLAQQLRHAAKISSVEGVEAFNAKVVDLTSTLVGDPELADLVYRAQVGGLRREDASDVERARLGYFIYSFLLLEAGMFERHRQGLLSVQHLEQYSMQQAGLMTSPYVRDVWPVIRDSYAADFRRWVEAKHGLVGAAGTT